MNRYTKDDWKVGQEVWIASHVGYISSFSAVVTKVGRKWVTARRDGYTRDHRFGIETGAVDSGDCSPRCFAYRSRKDFELEKARRDRVFGFVRIVKDNIRGLANDMEAEDMVRVLETLGLSHLWED